MVELASGRVTLPNTYGTWQISDHKDNTFTITLVTSKKDIDLRLLSSLEAFRLKYRVFITPLPLRWAEDAYYYAKQEYISYKDWQLEQDFINNTQ